MRIKMAMMIGLVVILMSGSQAFGQGKLQIEDIQSEIVGSPDSGGNVQFSVKATVFDMSGFGTKYSIQVQGLDDNGSPLITISVQGYVEAGSRGWLVGQGSMPLDKYSSIVNWVKGQ
jgi:hypothetical protein